MGANATLKDAAEGDTLGGMNSNVCDPRDGAARCSINMGEIHLKAGDLVSAYGYFKPLGEAGDQEAVAYLIEICERAGDSRRAALWSESLLSVK